MSVFEKIANISLGWVAVIVTVLLIARWILRKRSSPISRQAAELCESLAIAGALVFFIIRPFIVQSFFIPSESMLPTLKIHDHIMVNKFIYRFREPNHGDVIVFKSPEAASPDGQRRDFIKRVIAVPGDVVRITPGRVMVGKSEMDHKGIREALADLIRPDAEGAVKFVKDAVILDGRRIDKKELAERLAVKPAEVRIVPAKVYINGKRIDEPYLNEDPDIQYPVPSGPLATPRTWLVLGPDGGYNVKIPRGRLLVMGDNRNNSYDSRFWGLLDRRDVLGKAMFRYIPLSRIGVVK
jgi:signal peptidase I